MKYPSKKRDVKTSHRGKYGQPSALVVEYASSPGAAWMPWRDEWIKKTRKQIMDYAAVFKLPQKKMYLSITDTLVLALYAVKFSDGTEFSCDQIKPQ